MSVAFLFPGQGAQHPGMLREMPDHPAVHETLREAGEVLGRDPLELDGADALASNVAAQLALLVAGVACARALAAGDARPDFVAGHSVGAFPAAVGAGVLAFSDAVRVVELRAGAMQDAYPEGYGMGVIVGLDERAVAGLVERAGGEDGPVYSTNVNAPRQLSVSGSEAAVERALELARRSGATRAKRLPVPVPSHSPLMAEVADKLSEALDGITLRPPVVPYVSNVGGRALRGPEEVRDDLARSVARPVRWHEGTSLLYELGVRLFVELPPGDVLARLAASAFPDARSFAVGSGGLDSALLLTRKEREATA